MPRVENPRRLPPLAVLCRLVPLLTLAACSAEQPNPAVRYAGTWEGRAFRSSRDTGITWRAIMSVAQDGALTGSVAFAGGSEIVPLTTVTLTDSTLSQRLGPYHSPTLDTLVTAVLDARLAGDSLFGSFEVQAVSGERGLKGTFGAARRTPALP